MELKEIKEKYSKASQKIQFGFDECIRSFVVEALKCEGRVYKEKIILWDFSREDLLKVFWRVL